MKKIILFAALVLGVFAFSSCTSTFGITTKTVYQKAVNQIGTTQYRYDRIRTGTKVTPSEYTLPTTSTISKISYETEPDGDIVAKLHLADDHVITVSVVNGIMYNPQFLYGKEMKYHKTHWRYDTTYLYQYQKTTSVVKDGQVTSSVIDTVADFTSDIKFARTSTHTDAIPVKSSYPAYYNESKRTVIDYKEKDTLHVSSYDVPLDRYKTWINSFVFEMPLYDTTVTSIVDDAKSKTDVKCIKKRIVNGAYQLKLCRVERTASDMPRTVSRWVNTDKETYDMIHIPEQYFILVSDYDRFYDDRTSYLPASCLSHLYDTGRTQVVIRQ